MNAIRQGGLFEGYSGLSMAVEEVFGAELAWYSEVDKGALKILAHRFPNVPNVGDVTAVDWSQVEPIDILTGGSPCQDLSHAGRRAGMTEGTRSNLWVAMREAIAQLNPALVVWENVGGAFSAAADSEVEPCAGCVGDGPGVHLRALGRVLGDLSSLGYDASWHALRAADIGAPHGRLRVFVVAGDARGIRRHEALQHDGRGQVAGDWRGVPHQSDRDALRAGPDRALTLLPTPRATDGTKGGPNQAGSSGDLMLPSAVQPDRLLPTPSVADAQGGHHSRSGDRSNELLLNGVAYHQRWGDYGAAIQRWEGVLGRTAPAPTMTGARGNPQLSPAFVEWMMGLPAGWVTDVPGITRNEALKALGNGVVWQQAAHAIRTMLTWAEVAA